MLQSHYCTCGEDLSLESITKVESSTTYRVMIMWLRMPQEGGELNKLVEWKPRPKSAAIIIIIIIIIIISFYFVKSL